MRQSNFLQTDERKQEVGEKCTEGDRTNIRTPVRELTGKDIHCVSVYEGRELVWTFRHACVWGEKEQSELSEGIPVPMEKL